MSPPSESACWMNQRNSKRRHLVGAIAQHDLLEVTGYEFAGPVIRRISSSGFTDAAHVCCCSGSISSTQQGPTYTPIRQSTNTTRVFITLVAMHGFFKVTLNKKTSCSSQIVVLVVPGNSPKGPGQVATVSNKTRRRQNPANRLVGSRSL